MNNQQSFNQNSAFKSLDSSSKLRTDNHQNQKHFIYSNINNTNTNNNNNQNQNNLNGGDNYDLFNLYSFNKNNQIQGKYNVEI